VLLNAAAALAVAGAVPDLAAGVREAASTIDAGLAREKLMRLVELTNR
ncbi:MAG: anthranilate phosphoribosyltransferase, partial [Proteobacteria bacterium]|nr:anthranilate phosphoribosyltransferase [Pseudomonadota bacterium]